MKKILCGLMVTMLSGCAFHAQKVTLDPTLNTTKSVEGAGISIALRVVDERENTSLGHRGTAYGAAAEISSSQDVAALVQSKISEGLNSRGYRVVPYQQAADRQLTFEVRSLNYSTSTGFWTGGLDIAGAMKARATSGPESFEQFYRVDDKKRVGVVPTAGTNAEWINDALSEMLQKIFNDTTLFRFLTQGT